MSAPNLSISPQPEVGGKIVYLPLAPAYDGAPKRFKLVVRLDILNQETSSVTVSKIEIGFPNSALPTADMMGVDLEGVWEPKAGGPTIKPGETKIWSNGAVGLPDKSTVSNVLYLDAPAPAKVKVSVWCTGYTSPATLTRNLSPHVSANAHGYYLWPLPNVGAKKSDKNPFPTAFYVSSAVHWANGGPWGNQIFAHDITLKRHAGAWTTLKEGGDSNKNDGYLIWERDVLAMADGVVESVLNSMNDNTTLKSFPDPTPDPVSGNHVIMHHGSERMIYAHMRKGSIPGWIVAGAKVKQGDKLGKIGNSGNSTEPHIHIEVSTVTGGYLRPIVFRGLRVCDVLLLHPPTAASPWAAVDYAGLPQENVAIYRSIPKYAPPHRRPAQPRFPKPRVPHTRTKKKKKKTVKKQTKARTTRRKKRTR